MPLRIPDKLPAIELLKHENIFVMDESRAHKQEIRPLKICVLNLMPLKITTETDLVRLLSNTPLQLEVYFMKLKSHTPKNTPIEHMMMFYKDFQELSKQKFDGMIVTGAPIETMAYEEVEYWPEIKEIFDWARTHVTSTLYICWSVIVSCGLFYCAGVCASSGVCVSSTVCVSSVTASSVFSTGAVCSIRFFRKIYSRCALASSG